MMELSRITDEIVTEALIDQLIAMEAQDACKPRSASNTVSLEIKRMANQFEEIDHLMDRYDRIENLFAA